MYAHLLVPLDGSDFAEHALPEAIELAQRFESRITLLTIVPPPHLAAGGFIPDSAELYQRLRDAACNEATGYLMEQAQKLQAAGITVDHQAIEGEPVAECILDFTEKSDVDTIVMCTHGRSGLQRWVFGSVAEKLLRATSLPVILIRPKQDE
jgi:nucleotide-binding universal stress UspA family protein